MCLNCGCMRAHDDMGKPGVNITYEDVKRAADANGKSVDETLQIIRKTSEKDRAIILLSTRRRGISDVVVADQSGTPSWGSRPAP